MRISSNLGFAIFVSEMFFLAMLWYYLRVQNIIVFDGFLSLNLETLPILRDRGFIATCSLSDINYLCPLGYSVYLEIFALMFLIGIPMMILLQKIAAPKSSTSRVGAVIRRNAEVIERRGSLYVPIFKILFAIAIVLIQFLIGPEIKEGRDLFGNITALFGSYWFAINVFCIIIAIGLFWQNNAPVNS
jgi:hypothetical protein